MDFDSQVHAIGWDDDALVLLDQRALPGVVTHLRCESVSQVASAIRDMVVRGAPAIGVSAVYGAVLSVRDRAGDVGLDAHNRAAIERDLTQLAQARPTAVNLAWAVKAVRRTLDEEPARPLAAVRELARRMHAADTAANRRMGELGAALIDEPCEVITHCNAGALATTGYGTALGVIRCAHAQGKIQRVLADETRPWFQGARLTAWELVQDQIPVALIADGAATWAMRQGKVKWVIVGADRVAANGDVANKIGTYSLAISARHHGVGFMVVAPLSTIDLQCPDGAAIPIEQRQPEELLLMHGEPHAPAGAQAWNPVFDVTPAALVDALVTEAGVLRRPDSSAIRTLFSAS